MKTEWPSSQKGVLRRGCRLFARRKYEQESIRIEHDISRFLHGVNAYPPERG